MTNNIRIQKATLYYQTDAETGGHAGWAYNVIDSDGEHTSDGLEVGDSLGEGARLSDVLEAFAAEWPEAAAAVSGWEPLPDGGWTARGDR